MNLNRFFGLLIVVIAGGYVAGKESTEWFYSGIREQFRLTLLDGLEEIDGTVIEAAVDEQGPKAFVVGGSEYDFGTMERSGRRRHTFVIQNTGNMPLKLEKGETTCKCTLSALKGGLVQPNEYVEVVLEWTAREISLSPVFTQSADIHTNDPNLSTVRLTVTGTIVQSVWSRPDRVQMGKISSDEGGEFIAKLYSYASEELKIESHEFTGPADIEELSVSFEPIEPEVISEEDNAKTGQYMKVKLAPGRKQGVFNQTIVLTTSLPDSPKVEIPISGEVVPDIAVYGRGFNEDKSNPMLVEGDLKLGIVSASKGRTAELRIVVKGAYKDEVRLNLLSQDLPRDLRIQLADPKPLANGKAVHHNVSIEIPKNAAEASHLGGNRGKPITLMFGTSHPFLKTVKVNVFYAILKQ